MAGIPAILPAGLEPYARSPDFTPENLPVKLQAAHATKAGAWGLLHVLSGRVRYCLEPPDAVEVIASAGEMVVIEPQVAHHVSFVEPGCFFIEFYRAS
ncbi:hypothetical protein GCM10019059_33440 [Camelimonas fluminis]|uniref:DUF1971 domain-containing protein n=1 Tax=Camelimonas fluminis TaxID=1576911 RepID=A0ABV7UH13_9HYPH|nr:DUF1971 domain-containing protein [Camelimonas fluminis]GHE71002.1 hypothetical protein GCM10019059_33440 [Camelimonas fluminis]